MMALLIQIRGRFDIFDIFIYVFVPKELKKSLSKL